MLFQIEAEEAAASMQAAETKVSHLSTTKTRLEAELSDWRDRAALLEETVEAKQKCCDKKEEQFRYSK